MKRFLITLCTAFMVFSVNATTISWYGQGELLGQTTCINGESVVPPPVPEKNGYHFKEWKNLYIGTMKTTSTGGNDASIKLNINGTEINMNHRVARDSVQNFDETIRVGFGSGNPARWDITNISPFIITINSQAVNPGATFSWPYTQSVNYEIYYDPSNW